MQLVQGAVHAHGDPQALEPLVFPPFLYNGGQASATELGRPPGHSSAHLLHHNAVLTRAVQAELLQDPPDLEEGQPITAGKHSRMSGSASWGPGTRSAWLTALIPGCPGRREEKMIQTTANLEQNALEAETQEGLPPPGSPIIFKTMKCEGPAQWCNG